MVGLVDAPERRCREKRHHEKMIKDHSKSPASIPALSLQIFISLVGAFLSPALLT